MRSTPPGERLAPTITQMCGWLEVSRSGFYDWRTRAGKRDGEKKGGAQAADQEGLR